MTPRVGLVVLVFAGVALSPAARPAPSAADASSTGVPRIVYASNWSGVHQVYSIAPRRGARAGQLTFGSSDTFEPVASPNGRRIAYLRGSFLEARTFRTGALWVARADGSSPRRLVAGMVSADWPVAWSPDSSELAYRQVDRWHVVGADGSNDRVVRRAPRWADRSISPDGQWVLARTPTSIAISSRRSGPTYTFEFERAVEGATYTSAWSPDSRQLAFASARGISAVDLRTGRARRLANEVGFALAWAPDSSALAFVQGRGRLDDLAFESGDLRLTTLGGRTTTVVRADRAHGGAIVDLAWTRPPAGVRYRAPEPAPATRVAPDGLLAGGEINRLAADGERVAFNSCSNVYAWTPASGAVTPLGQSGALGSCRTRSRTVIHSLAVAGDRVAYGERVGCTVITITLYLEVLAPSRRSAELARGYSNCGAPSRPGFHRLTGSGRLLVFSALHEPSPPPGEHCCRTELEEIDRVADGGCPCPVLSSSPGPLAPADVDADRIVAFGDNATLVLDPDGEEVLSVPVSPVAAQLSGSDLVLLLRGRLRVYDAATGALRREWPLPDVPSGGTCDLQCIRDGDKSRLRLQDVAHGLAAYVLDGDVHVLRLADGADAVVGRGAHARFLDAGLVVAYGARLRLVRYDRLPLR